MEENKNKSEIVLYQSNDGTIKAERNRKKRKHQRVGTRY